MREWRGCLAALLPLLCIDQNIPQYANPGLFYSLFDERLGPSCWHAAMRQLGREKKPTDIISEGSKHCQIKKCLRRSGRGAHHYSIWVIEGKNPERPSSAVWVRVRVRGYTDAWVIVISGFGPSR